LLDAASMSLKYLPLLVLAGCPAYPTMRTEVAAPEMYRPPHAAKQWLIEGAIDTNTIDLRQRTLHVDIDGVRVVDGPLPTDVIGRSTGTLDGTYRGAQVHVDCSSERKTQDWAELRCRVLVDSELATTLVM
jgi:hypothetical protein